MTDTPKLPEAKPGAQVAHDTLMQFFTPIVPGSAQATQLAEMQGVFREMSEWMLRTLPFNSERAVALRYLLEAKESCSRAILYRG